jgi:hypothetical protein
MLSASEWDAHCLEPMAIFGLVRARRGYWGALACSSDERPDASMDY